MKHHRGALLACTLLALASSPEFALADEVTLTCSGSYYNNNSGKKGRDVEILYHLDVEAGQIRRRDPESGVMDTMRLTRITDAKLFWFDERSASATLDRVSLQLVTVGDNRSFRGSCIKGKRKV